ncbi:hypothetical protein BKA67DRAFT_658183 [Truncatella angustata]|uniref:Prolyl 4-hydroxylase alpha subunit Fe(2+) 2OG dioxygenase domain-containing protein n=1 Tax=Truncatella angustata TaxID=152316 RepID=A0A9P8UJW5_9PEZI|nr:uncharacterized protein BKA67DRAFT_658183 [Truncatella angustata]KAH6653845.1 hypothetical protein BKA67DRAFT_658183 [Truncatella angustata]
MLLYEKGAMFKAHTDTEKIPGMFGTLVISLPSPHVGGDVVLKHGGEEKSIKTSTADMSFVCWYSNISYEVLPVTEGYRWVLTYNLATNPAEEIPSAASLQENALFEDAMEVLLKKWLGTIVNGVRDVHSPLYYCFAHEYTEASISLKGLKMKDKTMTQRLLGICKEKGFDLFLATLEKEQRGSTEDDGSYDRYGTYARYGRYGENSENSEEESDGGDDEGHHSMDEVYGEDYRLKTVFDLHGNQVVSGLAIDIEDILQDTWDIFEGDPDDEEYEGYMGNSGPDITHWYRKAALVIVPSQGTFAFLSKGFRSYSYISLDQDEIVHLTTWYVRRCLLPTVEETALKACVSLCQRLLQPGTESYYPVISRQSITGSLLCAVLKISLMHDQRELLELTLAQNKEPIPTAFFVWAAKDLDRQKVPLDKLKTVLCSSIQAQPRISLKYDVILELNTIEEAASDILQDIIISAAQQALESCKTIVLYKEDGPAVFELARYHKNFDYITDDLTPLLENSSYTPFMLSFLKMLRQAISCGQIARDAGLAVYKTFAESTIKAMNLSTVTACEESELQQDHYMMGSTVAKPELKPSALFMEHDALTAFVESLFQFDMDKHLELLADKLSRDAKNVNFKEFNPLYIPILEGLLISLETHKVSLQTDRYQRIFQALLKAYVGKYVGIEPQAGDWTRRTVTGCICLDCQTLNRFLEDSSAQSDRYCMAEKRRKHLVQKLNYGMGYYSIVTERGRTPYTLVVTKTTKPYDNKFVAWVERRLTAENKISAFDQEKLKLLLADRYDKITSMRQVSEVRTAGRVKTSNPANSVISNVAHPNLGLSASSSRLTTPRPHAATSSLSRYSLSHMHPSTSPVPKSPSAPFTLTSRNIHEEVARLQAEIARAGGIAHVPSLPSSELAKYDSAQRSSTQSSIYTRAPASRLPPVPPLAGTKRKAAEVVDLTGDSD